MIDLIPRHQLGYILPVDVADGVFYQFYRVYPNDCLMVGCPISLKSFSPEGVEKALEKLWDAFDFLVGRGVDRIVQGGIPVSATAGRKRILGFIEEAARRSSIPTSADFEEVIEAFQQLGVRRVAVAAKWDERMMQDVSDYLADAGIETVERYAEAHTAQQVVAINPQQGVDLAVHLGRSVLNKAPKAEGLLLAGGAWLSLAAIPILEAEFGIPVVTNPCATYWAGLKQFGLHSPVVGWGRLLDSLQPSATTGGQS